MSVFRVTPAARAALLCLVLVSCGRADPPVYVVINGSGAPIHEGTWDAVSWNLAPALIPVMKGQKWGYISRGGKVVVAPQYDLAHEFVDGKAAVNLGAVWLDYSFVGGKWGAIDEHGDVIDPVTSDAPPAVAHHPAGRPGERDPCSRTPDSPEAFWIGEASEGLRTIGRFEPTEGRWRWGFTDPDGREVVPRSYDEVRDFREGLAAVRVGSEFDERGNAHGGGWGFIDRTGHMVIASEFEDARSFSAGLAPVARDGKWGYIDGTGRIVIDFRFQNAWPFQSGLAIAALERS